MKRKEFIKTCGYACLGATVFAPIMQGCVSTKSITATIEGEKLLVPLSNFEKDGKLLKYLIVNNSQLQYPIYVFRFSESKYTALYMQCTHQGNEVTAYGEKLVCSAHGSEFDNKGDVTNGPASSPLRTFQTNLSNQNILISLKKA
ncbi:Rieske (2Fe-2S) protein [uncultured Aquimarina sp.]|uniref:QcrA and Rieske domain-containing protein n=1 Tax=uncultured Aquimarina sp. TaxID=575652 RepID=UPI00260C9C94|nr:Rieske (2Fe-2S) protein [uncultured Aquimarina sp.]